MPSYRELATAAFPDPATRRAVTLPHNSSDRTNRAIKLLVTNDGVTPYVYYNIVGALHDWLGQAGAPFRGPPETVSRSQARLFLPSMFTDQDGNDVDVTNLLAGLPDEGEFFFRWFHPNGHSFEASFLLTRLDPLTTAAGEFWILADDSIIKDAVENSDDFRNFRVSITIEDRDTGNIRPLFIRSQTVIEQPIWCSVETAGTDFETIELAAAGTLTAAPTRNLQLRTTFDEAYDDPEMFIFYGKDGDGDRVRWDVVSTNIDGEEIVMNLANRLY